jgi:hypothetical protein
MESMMEISINLIMEGEVVGASNVFLQDIVSEV